MQRLFFEGAHNVLVYIGVICCAVFLYGVFDVLDSELEIRVVSEEAICVQPLNNRCRYQYTVEEPDGQQVKMFVSGFVFDADDWAAGNLIKKKRFNFKYSVNGHSRVWPFAINYFCILLGGVFAIGIWLWISSTVRHGKG
jgi:hypothetical protein